MTNSIHQPPVVVITGASSGIGAALAYALARQGAWLVLAARRFNELETVAEKCRTLGGQAVAIVTDMNSQTDCQQLIAQAVQTYGRIDTLINNAGITMWARFSDLQNPAMIDQIMQVNFMGSVYCTYYALPYLKQTHGRIVCVSSMAEKLIAPGNTGYVASKRAMDGFFESLRAELVEDGVSVTMMNLGFIDTGFAGRMLDAKGQVSKGIEKQIGKQMSAEECARLIIAASDARKRQVLMPVSGLPGWLLPWIKLIAPDLLERVGRRFMQDSGL